MNDALTDRELTDASQGNVPAGFKATHFSLRYLEEEKHNQKLCKMMCVFKLLSEVRERVLQRSSKCISAV